MAIKTILVGCDLSGPSDQALDRAISIAVKNGSLLVLVHAQAGEPPVKDVDPATLAQIGEVSAAIRVEEARAIADRLTSIQGFGVTTEIVSRIGPADEVIAAAALEHNADLIVLGSHGHTGITRLLLGSVASSTIRQSACDVLIVRGAPKQGTFQRPVVATDFSPAADKALAHTAALCDPGVPIRVIHAWELPAGSWGASLLGQARFPWSMVRDAVVSSAKGQADHLLAMHRESENALSIDLIQGPPASVITEAAEQTGHDLIAVGAHGHRGFRRLLLGSVAESTVRHAPCSVLVVHGDAHAPAAPSH